jgi:hypothetical protein
MAGDDQIPEHFVQRPRGLHWASDDLGQHAHQFRAEAPHLSSRAATFGIGSATSSTRPADQSRLTIRLCAKYLLLVSRPAHGPGGKAHVWGHCATPYFPSIIMLPSMSLSEWLGPKLSSRLLVSIRRPLLAPSVILPTRWV